MVWGTTGQAFCRMSSYWDLCDVFLSSPGAVGFGKKARRAEAPFPPRAISTMLALVPGPSRARQASLWPPPSPFCPLRGEVTRHSSLTDVGTRQRWGFFFFPPIFFWTMSTFKNVYVAEFINIFLCGAWIFDSWLETLRSYAELLVCFLVPMVSHFTINV